MEGMHQQPTPQLFPSLLAIPAIGPAERARLLEQSRERLGAGLSLLTGGVDDAIQGYRQANMPLMLDAATRLRLGLSQFESGVSTHLALTSGQNPQAIAIDWFKTQMRLGPGMSGAGAAPSYGVSWLDVSPAHLTTMALLATTAASLLLLQFVRLRKVKLVLQRVSPSSGTGPAPPSAEPFPKAARGVAIADETVPPARMPPVRKAWSGKLKVAHIFTETPTIKTFRLVEPSGAPLPFTYLPGQFMQVAVRSPAKEILKRAYTIASSPTRTSYAELSIKREPSGKVSQHLHDNVGVGDLLEVSAPYGAFTFTGMDEDSIVLIGGGVGITPLMSVVRYLTDLAWPGSIYCLFSVRSTAEFAFHDELEYLQRRHANLHVLATMTRAQGTSWMGPEGPITKALLEATVPELAKRRIHVCGPPPMMSAMKEALTALGVPAERIHTEAFGPASLPAGSLPAEPPSQSAAARVAATSPHAQAPPAAAAAPVEVAEATITFQRSGRAAPLSRQSTVLETAEAAGVDIPWSCRVGICGACKVRLLQGEVSMEVEEGLEAADKANGMILACQAKTTGRNLSVDA
jgi:ferredoxin-NADP reductase